VERPTVEGELRRCQVNRGRPSLPCCLLLAATRPIASRAPGRDEVIGRNKYSLRMDQFPTGGSVLSMRLACYPASRPTKQV
jgi:hypothetical protein